MGNRAVIVSKDTTFENKDKQIGIYVHWHGSEDTVKEFLQEAKDKGVHDIISDPQYGWARLCQIIADNLTQESLNSEFSKDNAYETGIGIGIVSNLDCRNFDNGVYYIDENFEIVKHTNGKELENKLNTPNTNKLDLETILEEMTYDSAEDCPTSGQLENILKEKMPGYDITLFDMDDNDYNSLGDTIAKTIQGKTVEDIQTMEWCIEEQDVYYYIVAIKIKE